MGDLLRNEIAAYGGAPEELVGNPGDATDQGQDTLTVRPARVTDTNDQFIPIGTTLWQFKAELRAPSEAAFRSELAKPRPTEVLGAGGYYRFIAQQPSVNEEVKETLLRSIAGRRRGSRVGFFAQARLAERARRFPALALLRFFNRPLERVHPYEWWSREHQATEFDEPSRERELASLVEFLGDAPRPAHARVVGPAGVGKTRLVLEALRRSGLAATTVYAANPNEGHFDRLFQWLGEHARAIVVVDECDEPQAAVLKKSAVDRGLRILLITIGRIEDDATQSLPPDRRITVPPMQSDDVERILHASTRIDRLAIVQIARLTGGFIKLARVVAEAVEIQGNAFDAAALIHVDVIQQAIKSLLGVADDALRWLSVLSLFSEVRIDGRGEDADHTLLAQFVGVSLPDVAIWNQKAITAQVLSDRGGRVFVTPTLLAVLLARDLVRLRRADIGGWLPALPRRLQEAFTSQLGQLRYSDEGRALAAEMIGDAGPFGDLLAERQPWARSAFLALGTVAQEEALQRLQTWLVTDPKAAAELAGDRDLGRLLFRLIWRPNQFDTAFSILITALSAAPDLKRTELRELLGGALQISVASSQAPFPDRFEAASEAFLSNRYPLEVRRLILRSLAFAVGAPGSQEYSDGDIDVGGRRFWQPKTHGDVWRCTQLVVGLLVGALDDRDPIVQRDAAAHLIDHAADFIRWGGHAQLLQAIEKILSLDPRVGTLHEELDRGLAFDKLSDATRAQVQNAISRLPQDLASRIRVLTEGWQLVTDRARAGLGPRPEPGQVAGEIMASEDRDRLLGMLFENWAKNTGDLLIALARQREAFNVWPLIHDAARRANETWGVCLFLATAAENSDASPFAPVPEALLLHDDLFDVSVGAETITRMEARPEQLASLCVQIRAGRIRPEWLRYAVMGRWTERRPKDLVAELIRSVAALPGGRPTALAITHAAENNLGLSDAELIELLASAIWDVRGHDAWTWQQVARLVLPRNPRSLAHAVINSIRTRYENRASRYEHWADDEVGQILEACVEAEPSTAGELLDLWDALPEFVESLSSGSLIAHVEAKRLGEWANTEQRQRALAKFVPVARHPTAQALLERFGSKSVFARRLRENLFPSSWSGSLSKILSSSAREVETWASIDAAPHSFRQWARESADALRKASEKEKRRELEEDA